MSEGYANNFVTALTAAIDADDVTISVRAAAPAALSGTDFRILIGSELLIVTAGEGTTTWTVTRGAEGTTAAAHAAQSTVAHVLTVASLSEKRKESARLAVHGPAGGTFVYDDFDRADGTLHLTAAPTGQTWTLTGAGQATAAVSGRKLTSTANVYAFLDYGAAITRVSGTFSFGHGLGTDDRTTMPLTLIASNAVEGVTDMLHLNVGPTRWVLTKVVNSVSTLLVDGYHDLINDVPYDIAMEVSGTTVTVYPPQGTPRTATDAVIGTTIAPTAGCWQINPATDSLIGKWWRTAIGPSQQGRMAAASGAAPSAEVGWLRGTGLTKRQRVQATLTGAGWYRIANRASPVTYTIAGTVVIDAIDQYRQTVWRAYVGSDWNAVPVMSTAHVFKYQGGPVTALRMSTDTSTYDVVLDMYVANGDPVTLTLEFEGYFTPVVAPVVGATALPTQSVTLNA